MNQITKDYYEIEKKIHPFVKYLENKKNSKPYCDIYKGIITMNSPVIMNPEILFIGVNAGPGAYNELNNNGINENKTPLRMLGENEMCFNELNWYEKGTARGGKVGKKWVQYNWYDRDKKVNNVFTTRMIDMLYVIGKLKYPNEYAKHKYENGVMPFWYESLGKRIMATNLYPISTKNYKDLKRIHELLIKETELIDFWRPNSIASGKVNEWRIRLYFIKLIEEVIDLVKPKLIVCLGKMAFHDFTFTRSTKGKIVTKIRTVKGRDYKVIGFSRRGNWSGLIEGVAKEISS